VLWLGVSESWFYKWHDRPPTARQERRAELDEAVRASFEDSGGTPGTYGSPRVFEDLVEAGWHVSKKTVAASMARQGLQGRSPKRKRRCLTRPDKTAEPIPDLVGRDFSTGPVDQRWCGDLTEIPTGEGKLYLATVSIWGRVGFRASPSESITTRRWPRLRCVWPQRCGAARSPG
jgi:transposase InsO family protein